MDAQPDLRESTAAFLSDAFAAARRTCRELVANTQQLRFLGHYSQDLFDFSFDVLDASEPELAGVQRIGRQVGQETNTLDRVLRDARTGGLIRTVLHTERAGVICQSVVPGEVVLGLCFDDSPTDTPDLLLTSAPEVRAADLALSGLVDRLRAVISLPSLNPGGWASADDPTALELTRPAGPPEVWQADAGADSEVLAACRAAVRPEDLQFVGHCAGGELLASVDQLGHPTLAPFFTQISVGARREFYRGFSERFGPLQTKLNRLLAGLTPSGLLLRVVLDVELGAIFCYRLGTDEYLVGVTVAQARVSRADQRMAELARSCAALLDGR
ncbi:MAG TPA: hypothetical protein VHZ97_00225 [Pseudonocardiaceae bacterium]|jgi:hypothetical protein|nr:hypothetical protein [Pseudonocardiaceae bacterium]